MPRLENWSCMKDKSRVVPTPRLPKPGDLVGGDVYGSSRHKDGTTITTGDVVEVHPGRVVTKSGGGTETYELGKWVWDEPSARKALDDPITRDVFREDA